MSSVHAAGGCGDASPSPKVAETFWDILFCNERLARLAFRQSLALQSPTQLLHKQLNVPRSLNRNTNFYLDSPSRWCGSQDWHWVNYHNGASILNPHDAFQRSQKGCERTACPTFFCLRRLTESGLSLHLIPWVLDCVPFSWRLNMDGKNVEKNAIGDHKTSSAYHSRTRIANMRKQSWKTCLRHDVQSRVTKLDCKGRRQWR